MKHKLGLILWKCFIVSYAKVKNIVKYRSFINNNFLERRTEVTNLGITVSRGHLSLT